MRVFLALIFFSLVLSSCGTKAEGIKTSSNEVLNELPNNQSEISPVQKPVQESNDIDQKVGFVDYNYNDQILCLRINNSNLLEKISVKIIDPFEQPQQMYSATVEKKLNNNCTSTDSDIGVENPEKTFYYSLTFSDEKIKDSSFMMGIGLLTPSNTVITKNGLISIDINNDGKSEYFRHCSGIEGVFLTVWAGKPLKGKRIWHTYYYLRYDTVETCKKKDWEDIDE